MLVEEEIDGITIKTNTNTFKIDKEKALEYCNEYELRKNPKNEPRVSHRFADQTNGFNEFVGDGNVILTHEDINGYIKMTMTVDETEQLVQFVLEDFKRG